MGILRGNPYAIVIFIRRLRQEIKDRRNKYDIITHSIAARVLSSTSSLRPVFFPLQYDIIIAFAVHTLNM